MPRHRLVQGALVAFASACTDGKPAQPAQEAPPAPAAVPAKATPATFRVPKDDEIPSDEVGAAIRRGRALLQATRDSLPRYVGNKLRCMSCKSRGGRGVGAASRGDRGPAGLCSL